MLNPSSLNITDISQCTAYLAEVPFYVRRDALYTPEELFDVFDATDAGSFDRCYDTRVYHHMCQTGKIPTETYDMVARSMHDCSIRNQLHLFLQHKEQHRIAGIMGGHAMLRTDPAYHQAAEVSKRLTEHGWLMISGGGPGAMEATHLGAWMAGRSDAELSQAIEILSQAPRFSDDGWLATAFEVRQRFPLTGDYKSLAIPTWFYGHEPPCALATHIAKFFDNSIREDTILTIAYGGLIFMPGSAGTVQEVFQEICQDHYLTLGFASQMVFVGNDYWTHEVPVLPFIQHMSDKGYYKNLLISVADSTDDIIHSITQTH